MKKRFWISNVVFSLLYLSCLFLFPTISHAYTKSDFGTSPQGGFAVSPGKTELSLNAGESTQSEIIIINRNNFSADFFLTTEDFKGAEDDSNGVKLLGETEGLYSIKNYIVPEIHSFTLKAGEKMILSVNVTAPENASPRGYYGALVVSSSTEKTGEDIVKNTVTSRIASLFLVEIKGEKVKEGKFENFKITGPKKDFYLENPRGFEIGFKNTGNIHLSPFGEIKLKNIFGRTVEVLELKDFVVLPDSTRHREINLNKKFLFGKYEAVANVSNSYEESFQEIRLTFWVFPWKICLYAALAILLIVIIVRIISKLFFWKKKRNFSLNKNLE